MVISFLMEDFKEAGITTRCIHACNPKDAYGSVITPIYQTSTFRFQTAEQGGRRFAGEEGGFIYSRLGNPTTCTCEAKIANLEGAEAAALTSSGMGAISATLWTLLKAGDHVISDDCLYGCTHSLFENGFSKFGVEVTFVDLSIPCAVKEALRPNTKIVYFETPANPTMKIIDIRRVAAEAHAQNGVFVIVDNTFASPVITQPLHHGCDIVVHSVTKSLNGHSDVLAGAICSTHAIINKIKMEGIKDMTGCVLSPHDAYLVQRGLMTLELRIKTASENAMKMAAFLEAHPAVEKVYYPGLTTHPGHDIAAKQMNYYGSMISFELKSGMEGGKALLNNCRIMVLAVSLGGCESLIQHPASMTHACVSREQRLAAGITDGMVRLSVGIEGIDDLIGDMTQALESLEKL
jgi:methionine-gamma-lyase